MPGRRRLRISVIVTLVVALVAGGLAIAAIQTKFFTPSHRLPNIVDLTVRQASAKLRADHLHLQVARRRSSVTVGVGGIIREIPAAGTSLKEGSDVSVVVSSGPPPVAVPSLTGLTGGCPAVTAALGASHLRPDCTYQHSTQVNDGGVIDWNPKTRAPEFSTVTVLISQGPPIVTYPSLSGITTCDGVTSAFAAVGLTASCSAQYSSTVPSGGVFSESPPNQAPQGSTVTVVLSKGPAPVAVPPIPADRKLTDEINALQNAGLVAGNVWGPASGQVFQTNPSPGQMVLPGTSVNIYTK
jgi:serine/threonine-protein kinase